MAEKNTGETSLLPHQSKYRGGRPNRGGPCERIIDQRLPACSPRSLLFYNQSRLGCLTKKTDIVLAIRGLNLAKEGDYAVLLDNKLGQTKFDGGYVHNGLLKATRWVFDAKCEFLRGLVDRNLNYTLTFARHSLGAGVVALLVLIVVQNLDKFGNIKRNKIRCFAIAPTKCMSLNLAVRYEWIINGCERKGKTEEKEKAMWGCQPVAGFSLAKTVSFRKNERGKKKMKWRRLDEFWGLTRGK
ncbi:hypothetical protein KPL70_008080 [Citrus sinensis]|nr:hypothetical protein KPL70_008080 [Citrus sinensis]